MTNEEKLREIFPKTIFIYRKKDDKTTAIMCSDEWLNAEYKEPTTKNDLAHNLCDSCTNIRCELQSGIVRTKCAFYMPSITPHEPTIKALGEELRKARKGIADEKVLIGYNLAVAICNKHLGESEDT